MALLFFLGKRGCNSMGQWVNESAGRRMRPANRSMGQLATEGGRPMSQRVSRPPSAAGQNGLMGQPPPEAASHNVRRRPNFQRIKSIAKEYCERNIRTWVVERWETNFIDPLNTVSFRFDGDSVMACHLSSYKHIIIPALAGFQNRSR